ncbi:hypothetical protein BBC0122_000130 [Bartonella choladocola]|uniref:Uncharacterized protein n=1 Tax=Bartonella choladocola TaxID=2750995 RepID=A0A1U9ME44_9HYPH|nr:hypothetical protein BBC0122_000130 [Bartonella choladocola]
MWLRINFGVLTLAKKSKIDKFTHITGIAIAFTGFPCGEIDRLSSGFGKKFTHILSKNRFTLFGMSLLKCTHILSKNRFTLFGMSLLKCTHILSKNRFTLFGMSLLSARTSCPKTVSHFSGCCFKVHAHLVQKPFHTFWDVTFKCTHILSKNRFTLFGMWLLKCTHILSKNRFTLFGMWLLSARTSRPKTVSHFLGCACGDVRVKTLSPQTTFTTRSSSPSIWPTNSSPFCTGPTPAGVPVMIISPACNTNNCDK